MPLPDIIINTVCPHPFVAVEGRDPLMLQQRGLAETLVSTVQGVMIPREEGRFRIVRGPGSFTGIRVGLALGLALRLSGYTVQGVNALDALRASWLRIHGTPIPIDQPMMLPFYKDQVFLSFGGQEEEITITATPPAGAFGGPILPMDYQDIPEAPLTPLYGRASYVGV